MRGMPIKPRVVWYRKSNSPTLGNKEVRVHIAQKFEQLLDTYRHPDDRKWTGAELAKATGGIVPRSYVTNLRKGRIENPGYEKMRVIAKAMGLRQRCGSMSAQARGDQWGRLKSCAA